MAFVDQGEFEAMKTPISRRALRCDKDQFGAKMTVSTKGVSSRRRRREGMQRT